MKNLLYLFTLTVLFLFASVPTNAQATHVGATASIAPSSGSGYGTAYGGQLRGAASLAEEHLVVVGQIGVEKATKLYVGDGSTVRGRLEGRYYWTGWSPLRFFVSGGANLSRTITSQYTKQAVNGLVGGGVNLNDQFVGHYSYLLREHQTANEVSGHRFGLDCYVPLNSRDGFATGWQVLAGVEVTTWRFFQPGGPNAGENRANGVAVHVGIARARRR